jgi:hypothetical protein
MFCFHGFCPFLWHLQIKSKRVHAIITSCYIGQVLTAYKIRWDTYGEPCDGLAP